MIPNEKVVVRDVEVPYADFSKVITGYDDDQFFALIVKPSERKWLSSTRKKQD